MLYKIRRFIVRMLVFFLGYPPQDWPPGRGALAAYDKLHGMHSWRDSYNIYTNGYDEPPSPFIDPHEVS